MAKEELKKRTSSTADAEIKRPEQIVRQRLRLEYIKNKEKTNRIRKDQNRKKQARKGGKGGKGK